MDSSDSAGRPSSAADQPLVPAATAHTVLALEPLPVVPAYRVHTATDTVIHCISDNILATHSRHFGNKVVLAFEAEFSIAQARDWVQAYNLQSDIFLTISEELSNALFVVLFEAEDPKAAKLSLLSAPLFEWEIRMP